MIFRQLFDLTSSTYTYLLADARSREAILVDPVFERHQRDLALIRELGLRLVWTVDTHVHADHVTGAWLFREALGSRIALSGAYGAENVDRPLGDGDRVEIDGVGLEVRATPGHTSGCLTLVAQGQKLAFTGDTLLVRGAGRTDFQQGDAHAMWRSIRERIFTLPDDTLLYPAHDYEGRTVTTVLEEKTWNPRIGGDAREEDFVGYMQNLGLPHPKQMDLAVPANLRCGMPDEGVYPAIASWGPVTPTYGGVHEIDAEWVAHHRDTIQLLDVRTRGELEGELGAIAGSQHVPLDELRARVGEVPRDKPVVVVCQSGKRSAMATQILKKAGLADVANLAGGILRFRQLGPRIQG
jgi:glyoxylase-like metal-dependent hydrolase (beta-lactamase superfamily II)/rhodanese-related sulfurtransferase